MFDFLGKYMGDTYPDSWQTQKLPQNRYFRLKAACDLRSTFMVDYSFGIFQSW